MHSFVAFSIIFLSVTVAHVLSQTTSSTGTTTPYNIQCTSKYSPFYNGTCMPSANCLGATLTDICQNQNYVCCVEDNDSNIAYATNKLIPLATFLKFLGDTPRNRRLYNLFARSIDRAQITTCHQTAAYFAQLRGESRNLGLFEEPGARTDSLDFDTSIGNSETGDGRKYRGRGALLLRGKGFYLNATNQIPITKYNLVIEPEAAAFPSVAFDVAAFMWNKNSYVITANSAARKGSLNSIADGTFHNFTLITHAFTGNVQFLKERAQYYEDIVREIKCKGIKRGRGVTCEMGVSIKFGYAVPICLIDFKKSYCGCEGEFSIQNCPYGYTTSGVCRNPSIIKCCYEKCEAALDLVVIMDSSGSIGTVDFIKGLNFIKKVVEDLDIGENGTRVGLINYSTTASVVTNFTTTFDKTQLLQIITDIPYIGTNTNTQDALRLANDIVLQEANGMRPIQSGVPKVVMVITDGVSNVNAALTIPNANKIKARGFSVVSVGIGNEINQAELEGMASNKDVVYNADSYDQVFQIIESLLKTACEQPAKAIVEQAIEGKVNKNAYRYYKLTFENETANYTAFSVGLADLVGSTKLWFSFDDENPKDPADFLSNNQQPTNGNGNFIETRISKRELRARETIYQIRRAENKTSLFISVKGFSEQNEFQVYIYNRTVDVFNSQVRVKNNTFAVFICLILASVLFLI